MFSTDFENKKNIEITRFQRSSVIFNEPPYITLKASPKRGVGGSNPLVDAHPPGGNRKNRFPLFLFHKTISV